MSRFLRTRGLEGAEGVLPVAKFYIIVKKLIFITIQNKKMSVTAGRMKRVRRGTRNDPDFDFFKDKRP